MIKSTLKFLCASLFSLAIFSTEAQINIPKPSPLQKVTQSFGLGEISIEYSRPLVNDRKIFGDLVPFGQIWRTGANASTKITFTDDVKVEGKAVKAGTYALYTIPNKESWEIMLYSDLKLGGNVTEYATENEVLRVKVKTTSLPYSLESLIINLGDVQSTSAKLTLLWDKTYVPIQITTDIDTRVMKSIDESIASDKPAYFQAAAYYFENDKDLKLALKWVNKAIEEKPTAFYMMLLKAKIEYKLGDKAAGKASAEKTIELAKDAKNNDYIALAKKLLAEQK